MFEELKSILMEELDVDEALILPEAEFVSDLKLNSLELADFVVFCEEKFGTTIDEEDIHSILSIQDLMEYIEQKAAL